MRKTNVIKTVIVAAIMTASLGVLTGCSVEKNFTKTETHTVTDANGNTTTTTTTNHNGEVTTETTTTTADEAMASMDEEDMDFEEVSDVAAYENVPIAFTNNMGWDIKDFYLKMSSQDEWSDNFLDEDYYIDHDTTANGITVNYTEEQHFLDVRVADSNGDGEEFTEIELPAEGADHIEVVFGYDEASDTYTATVNAE